MFEFLKQYLRPKEAGVAVFKRKNGIFLHAEDKTDVGIWIAREPCIGIALDIDNHELGALIQEHLSKSKTNIKHSKEFKGLYNFVLKTVGVRSYKQFMSGCKHCRIH